MDISTYEIQMFEGISQQAKDLISSLVRFGGEGIVGDIRKGAESVTGQKINVHQVPVYEKQLKDAKLIKIEAQRGRRDTKWKVNDQEKVSKLIAISSNLTLGTMVPDEVFQKSFKEILTAISDLNSEKADNYDKGRLLEIFAGKICWLLGLQRIIFRRQNDYEVDVSAESVMPIYAPWLIQCKATTSQVSSEILLREYAIAQLEGAQIIMMVTIADFSSDCRNLANRIQKTGRQIVLLNGAALTEIADDEVKLYEIIRDQSRRTSSIKRGYNIQDIFKELDNLSKTDMAGVDKKVIWKLVEKSGIQVPEEEFDAILDAWRLQNGTLVIQKELQI
jgi:hypothetical protein